jgi:hypothetical protein
MPILKPKRAKRATNPPPQENASGERTNDNVPNSGATQDYGLGLAALRRLREDEARDGGSPPQEQAKTDPQPEPPPLQIPPMENSITATVGLWDRETNRTLPRTVDEACSIAPETFPPTYVVRNEARVTMVWWIRNEVPDHEASDVADHFHRFLKIRSASKGWSFHPHPSIAAVTLDGKEVVQKFSSGDAYSITNLRDYLVRSGIPTREQSQKADEEYWNSFRPYRDRIRDYVIDADGVVADDVLQRLTEGNPTFAVTWQRKREDLRNRNFDYDLELALIALNAGLDDQVAVNLVIHHRRLHGRKPELQVEYFQRLFGKAHRLYDQDEPHPSTTPGAGATAKLGPHDSQRRRQITAEVDFAEYLSVKERARKDGLTLGNLIRRALGLPPRFPGRPDWHEKASREDRMWDQLRELGVNPEEFLPPYE